MEIQQAILHILDKEADSLICSQKELDFSNGAVNEYVTKLVAKLGSGDVKEAFLDEQNQVMQLLKSTELNFIEKSSEIAKLLFDMITHGEEVPGGDLLVFSGIDNTSNALIGMIKLNYKEQFTHFLDYDEEALANKIIVNKTILPSKTQRVDEGVIIDTATGNCQIVEKKYLFEGEKIPYFSEKFLKTTPAPSAVENMKVVKKAIRKVSGKYNADEYISLSHTQKAVYESVEETGNVDVLQIAEAVFEENISAKNDYLAIVQEAGVEEKIAVDPIKYEKKYSKQKFKLDNGIELTIPIDIYQNKDLVEFINNPDGTISVMIKNVDSIKNKFSI